MSPIEFLLLNPFY